MKPAVGYGGVRLQEANMALQIHYLAEHLDTIPTLAGWHHEEWAAITPHLSVADRIAGFRARARRGTIPTGLVAVLGGDIVGLACLVQTDIESHAHLTPWLASVLVAPEHRGRGIASALCERAIDEARALGIPRVYLFTFNKQHLYSRLGWSAVESTRYAGGLGTVMMRTTSV
jgi:GNAT superfamily N-acetyltransferase